MGMDGMGVIQNGMDGMGMIQNGNGWNGNGYNENDRECFIMSGRNTSYYLHHGPTHSVICDNGSVPFYNVNTHSRMLRLIL